MNSQQYNRANKRVFLAVIIVFAYIAFTLFAAVGTKDADITRISIQLVAAIAVIVIAVIAFITKRDSRTGALILVSAMTAGYFIIALINSTIGTFDAYGVKTYVEMLGTNDAPGDWYPMWSYSNNFNTSTPGGVAWTKIGEVKHEQLPQVVMAKNFDKAWDTYMDAYNACNPQDFLDELQTELDKRLEQAAKFK